MDVLTQIRKPVEREMKDFESLFGITLQHQNPLLMIALRHVLSRKGKLMRPILTLLAAKKYGEINDSVLHAAVSLEMLHTASLVHDDVVDESSDGELQQLSNVKSDEISENQYFNVIRRKTASLFAVCAEVGALLSGASEDEIRRLGEFGTYVGICFQIRDDVFDYYDAEVGKPTGNDMKEGKLTLPVVHAVLQPGAETWHETALKVRAGRATEEEISALVNFTKQSGGIEYARRKMDEFHEQAVGLIGSDGNEAVGEALRLYLDFVLKRVS